jgi:hypothetical protein
MNYAELWKAYQLLQAENIRLKKENDELRKRLNLPFSSVQSDTKPALIDSLQTSLAFSPVEKIKLFKSLFRGREDVYAKRWQSNQTQRSGYQPV